MRRKILIIEKCDECPRCKQKELTSICQCDLVRDGRGLPRRLSDWWKEIPEWCPLKDAEPIEKEDEK